ncbi:MAG: hypothetical protein ACTSVF_05820 [Candidatus Asgardarchaeia archaeon]
MKEKLSKLINNLDGEVDRVRKEYADMISPCTAVYILAVENGLISNEKKEVESFSELKSGDSNVWISVRVANVFQPLVGKKHKSLRLLASDGRTEAMVVFWDDKVDDILKKRPEKGDILHIANGYFRDGLLHVGQYGKIEVEKKDGFKKLINITDGKCNVCVRIVEKVEIRTYRKDGEERRMATTWVADDTDRVRMVFWGKSTDKAEHLSIGDVICVKNAVFRNGELHLTSSTFIEINPENIIVVNRPEDIRDFTGALEGTIISYKIENGWVRVNMRTKTKDLVGMISSLDFRNIVNGSIPIDISDDTVCRIILKKVVGHRLVFKGRFNENGVFVIESILGELFKV